MGVVRSLLALSAALLLAQPAALADPVSVRVKTDRGIFTLELDKDKAPATVANFLSYVHRYYYDGLIFHRVVQGFVIQSGGYTYDLFKKEPGEPVINESANGLRNLRGTIAMARNDDPDSATSQFYINLNDNPSLDFAAGKPGYTVFGKVIEGMEVVEAIGNAPVSAQGKLTHLPVEPVQILSIREQQPNDQAEHQSQ